MKSASHVGVRGDLAAIFFHLFAGCRSGRQLAGRRDSLPGLREPDQGWIDLQLLGVGSNGHIAFNEPGSSLTSRTRLVSLTERTIEDNSRFFASRSAVPESAITMGVGTILEARRILRLASGKSKAIAVKNALQGPVSDACLGFAKPSACRYFCRFRGCGIVDGSEIARHRRSVTSSFP